MKIKINATILVLVCTVAVLGYFGYQGKQDRQFIQNSQSCQGCHEMQPAYYTWQATAHKQIACIECHQQINIAQYRDRHENGYVQPVRVKKRMANEVCLKCHSNYRLITPPGDVIIPHDLHMRKGIDCIDCHDNVAHANSVNKLLEPQVVTAQQFSQEDAQRLTSKGNRIPMSKCMVCHNGVKATKECAPCHSVLRLPVTHQAKDFAYNHGSLVFSNLASCNQCHDEELVAPKGFTVRDNSRATITTFSRNNSFCQNCHMERPVTHTAMYAVDHAQDARVSKDGCYVCHDLQRPKDYAKLGSASTNVYCAKCHYTKHTLNWEKTHKATVAAVGQAKCLVCHDQATSCNACHQRKRK